MAEFVWRVSKSGYEWRPAGELLGSTAAGLPFVLSTELGQGAREYAPLREPTAFREFAALGKKPASYITFANKYGHLTAGVAVSDEGGYLSENDFADQIRWPNGREETVSWYEGTELEINDGMETEALWSSHIAVMSSMIRKWERTERQREGIGDSEVGRNILANLRRRVTPHFEPSGALSFAPTDLLSALWLQFAQAAGGGHIHRRCLHCQGWFQVAVPTAGGRRIREDKKYCGEKCRMSAHYAGRVSSRSKAKRTASRRR